MLFHNGLMWKKATQHQLRLWLYTNVVLRAKQSPGFIELTLVYLRRLSSCQTYFLKDCSACFRFLLHRFDNLIFFSPLSVTFDNCSSLPCEASGPSVSFTLTAAADWFNTSVLTLRFFRPQQHQASHSTQNSGDVFPGAHLGIRATPQSSPTLMNYTCLASHLPRSSLCNVSHAWRIVCVYECLCGCIYIQTGIEGTVTHSLCSLFLPHNLPTHPPSAYF